MLHRRKLCIHTFKSHDVPQFWWDSIKSGSFDAKFSVKKNVLWKYDIWQTGTVINVIGNSSD